MATIVSYIQIAAILLVFGGEALCGAMKVEPPELLKTLTSNKFASFMFIWMVGNLVQTQLISTGAFEIYHGDAKIWSSLAEKRLPNLGDIYQAFEKTGVEF